MDIRIKDLTKSFDGKLVLDNLNRDIKENEFTCIMGESGIGKTTLINIIMGLMDTDNGEITGIDNKRISVVFQEDRLCEDFDAILNIRLVCDKKVSNDEIIQVLQELGLGDSLDKKVLLFSGGMKRRLAIARAIIAESEIVIMDEPFKGLDMELYKKTILYVKKKLKGKTVIIVTHREEECTLLEGHVIYIKK